MHLEVVQRLHETKDMHIAGAVHTDCRNSDKKTLMLDLKLAMTASMEGAFQYGNGLFQTPELGGARVSR